jgi:predicted phage terminase large subunit-like protein
VARLTLEAQFHEGQIEVIENPARFKVLAAGRRWGKTRLGVSKCLQVGLQGGRAWWVAPTYPMAMEGWRPLRRMAYEIPGAEVSQVDKEVRLTGGGLIQVRSADDPQRLRGAGLDFLVMDEAAFIKPDAWEVLRPALADRRGGALFISTPKGIDNWFHRLYDEPGEGWATFQFPTTANPYIDPDEVEAARPELGSLIFAQEYEAQFVTMGGTMFRTDWLRYATMDGDYLDAGRPIDLRECERFCTVDLAASTKQHADYTVIASCAQHEGRLVVLEIVRRRMEGPDIVPAIRQQIEKWHLGVAHIEKVGMQLHLIQQARRDGLPVAELRPDRDKIARALPLQARMEAGDVWFLRGDWVADLERELLAFPASEHDDQVDALAYAAAVRSRPKADLSGWSNTLTRQSPTKMG